MITKILILEDSHADYEIITREIKKKIENVEFQICETKEDFIKQIEVFNPQIIISDYSLPSFTGLEAIEILKEKNINIPLIITTGSQNEDIAVECMKAGAVDYVLKDNNKRIGNAILSAIHNQQVEIKKRETEQKLFESEKNYRAIFNSTNEAIFIHDSKNGNILDVNDSALKMFDYSDKELLINSGVGLLSAENKPFTESDALTLINNAIHYGTQVFEWLAKKRNGELFWVEVSLKSANINSEKRVLAVVRDISERKKQIENLKKLTHCLANLGTTYEENIDQLTSLFGELFGATCTLYNRLTDGMLCSIGQWNTPSDYNPIDNPEGHICYDVILNNSNNMFVVRDLQNTKYYNSDPNVKPYRLQTYIGKAVVCEGEALGSICAVFQNDIIPTVEHEQIITIIANAIGMQENRRKARKLLTDSEERYRTLFSIAPTGIILEDENGIILEVNEMICKSSGYSRNELINNSVKAFIKPEFHYIVEENIRKILNGNILIQEVESINKDGSIHNVELYEKRVLLPNGRPGILSISNYITERKKAENLVIKERDNLNNILHSSPVAMLVIDIDKNISYTNPASEDLFNKKKEDLIYKKCGEILECFNKIFENTECGKGIACKNCLINNNIDLALTEFREFKDFESEIKIEKNNLQTSKWLKISIKPVVLDSKNCIIISMSDITELKNAFRLIKDNEEKLTTLINATPDSICFKDEKGRWITANDSILKVFNLDNVDYFNKTDYELADYTSEIFKESFKNCAESDEKAYKNRVASRCEEIIPDLKGNQKHFDVIKIPIFNPDESKKGLVVFGRDITDMKKAKDELNLMLNRIEKQKNLIAEFSVSPLQTNGNLNEFSALITEKISKTFGISQVSIWLLDEESENLICSDLFNLLKTNHIENSPISRSEFKNEFKAFLNSKYIDANNPTSDSRTKGLAEKYLIPLNIKSLLDASIVVLGKTMGIVCFEYINQEHKWESDEINFACQIADIIAIAIQNRDKIASQHIIKKNEQRLKGLFRITQSKFESIQELLDSALNEAVLLTNSKIGFIYHYNEKTQLFTRNSWSKDVLNECDISVSDEKRNYHLNAIGFWGEAVRQRKPIIDNHFQEADILKKGYPEGHSMLNNFLVIPVFNDNEIVATVGVANKDSDYDDTDVMQLKLMMDTVWKIVQKKNDEEKIRQLSMGIEQSPAIIIITDKNGIIEYVNPIYLKITGYSFSEVIGKNIKDELPKTIEKEEFNLLWNNFSTGKEWQGEFLSKKKNGEFYWVSTIISPIKNERNETTHFIGVGEDITERKKMINELVEAKEKAEQVSLLKSRLLANMSHEIRTPLNGILGFAELMKDDIEDETYQSMAETIHSSGTRLMHTLNSILDLSLIETDSSKLELNKKDLNNLCKESYNLFIALANKNGLELISEISDIPMYAILDENLVNKILNNLINNAIKFTKSGSITIKTKYQIINDKEYACVEVHDTGIGIDEKHLNLIFEEFRQASEGTSRAYEGTGLGLNISLRFAKLMGGNISVESQLNKGSVFTLWLSAVDHDLLNEISFKEKKSDEITLHNFKNKKVLVVEDDPDSRKLVKFILKNICDLDIVENGNSALNNINLIKYDAILMDISLKAGINGIEVVKRIRNNSINKNTPIAAFTANAMTGHKEEYLKSGCSHYISKPFMKAELLNLLDEMLRY